jgi:hypothetical protein
VISASYLEWDIERAAMKNSGKPSRVFVSVATWAFAGLTVLCVAAHAQNSPYPADNSVWKPAGSGSALSNAHSYVDASMLAGTDICAQINSALQQVANKTSYPDYNTKSVIDARGITGINANLTCTSNDSNPWSTWSSGSTAAPAATLLLPAGTITISGTWTLPANTEVIGEGASVTTIVGSALNPIVEMGVLGNANFCGNNDCNGMGIQHLSLSSGAVGILNATSQEQSYVNDVWLTGITKYGLEILGQDSSNGYAVNSGPYSNIYFSGSGTCIDIEGTYGTRGIHGLTCIHTGSASGSAVLLDGSNNTIEDVFISNYRDGIVIGSQQLYSQSNVLLNIQGDSNISNSVVHICGPVDNTPCPSNYAPVAQPSDLTLVGISSAANKSTSYTVQDDMLGTNLKSLSTADPYVGLYILGEGVAGTPGSPGNAEPATRFTTSTSVPTWYVGSTPPTSGSPCQSGSLFSVTAGSSTPSLSLCVASKWSEFSANN